MFGEYALYCGDKVVALVCDDQLFVKIMGGHTWNVYFGTNGANDVVSFVRTSNTSTGNVDIKALLLWLIANDTTQYGRPS